MLEHFLALLIAALAGIFPAHTFSYTAPPPPLPEARATILFGGDMMFDRTIRTTVAEKGGDFLFSCIDPVLRESDLVVANLEGPITATSSRSVWSDVGAPDNFVFTFPTSTARLLASRNIRLVNLGNNHIMNFGRDGVLETMRWLTDAGVGYFGDPFSSESDKVARPELRGIPFSFVNWSDWTSDPGTTSSQSSDGYGAGKTNQVVEQVRQESQNGRIVVVYAHWGEEYVAPPARVRALAHGFVNAGAALVVGSHPHIVQEHEVYKGVHIYYSLGNFIFDQYWNEDVRHGLLVQAAFTPRGVASLKEIPIELKRDRRTCPQS